MVVDSQKKRLKSLSAVVSTRRWRALAHGDVKERQFSPGIEQNPSMTRELVSMVKSEMSRRARVIKAAHIKAE